MNEWASSYVTENGTYISERHALMHTTGADCHEKNCCACEHCHLADCSDMNCSFCNSYIQSFTWVESFSEFSNALENPF